MSYSLGTKHVTDRRGIALFEVGRRGLANAKEINRLSNHACVQTNLSDNVSVTNCSHIIPQLIAVYIQFFSPGKSLLLPVCIGRSVILSCETLHLHVPKHYRTGTRRRRRKHQSGRRTLWRFRRTRTHTLTYQENDCLTRLHDQCWQVLVIHGRRRRQNSNSCRPALCATAQTDIMASTQVRIALHIDH